MATRGKHDHDLETEEHARDYRAWTRAVVGRLKRPLPACLSDCERRVYLAAMVFAKTTAGTIDLTELRTRLGCSRGLIVDAVHGRPARGKAPAVIGLVERGLMAKGRDGWGVTLQLKPGDEAGGTMGSRVLAHRRMRAADWTGLNATALHLLLVLGAHSDAEGQAWPKRETLCGILRCDISTLSRALKSLGLTSIAGHRRRAVYRVFGWAEQSLQRPRIAPQCARGLRLNAPEDCASIKAEKDTRRKKNQLRRGVDLTPDMRRAIELGEAVAAQHGWVALKRIQEETCCIQVDEATEAELADFIAAAQRQAAADGVALVV